MAKQPYEKPIIEKMRKMDFPQKILQNGKEVVCRQCSSCHACR